VRGAVEHALRVGYKHVDCAPVYGNEKEVGEAFANVFGDGAVKREAVREGSLSISEAMVKCFLSVSQFLFGSHT